MTDQTLYDAYEEYMQMMLGYPSFVPDPVVDHTITVMEEWHDAILNGTANKRSPSLQGKRYTEEEVDKVIDAVMGCFRHELEAHGQYHANVGISQRGKPMDTLPLFDQLEGTAREAFVQDIKEAACAYS